MPRIFPVAADFRRGAVQALQRERVGAAGFDDALSADERGAVAARTDPR